MNAVEHKEKAESYLEQARAALSREACEGLLQFAQVHATLANIPDDQARF